MSRISSGFGAVGADGAEGGFNKEVGAEGAPAVGFERMGFQQNGGDVAEIAVAGGEPAVGVAGVDAVGVEGIGDLLFTVAARGTNGGITYGINAHGEPHEADDDASPEIAALVGFTQEKRCIGVPVVKIQSEASSQKEHREHAPTFEKPVALLFEFFE